MNKSNTCLFATVLCLIRENVYGRPKKREMDWQLVASYFTVKSTDFFFFFFFFFAVYSIVIFWLERFQGGHRTAHIY